VALTCACSATPPAAGGGDQSDPAPSWDDRDWAAFETKARRALEQRLDTVPVGVAVAAIARTFVGAPYVPGTLDPPGPESLVIDFRGFDCVTLVENVLALARFVREPGSAALLERRSAAEDRYEDILTRIRYRGGRREGYASRLHYFSEWIADAAAKGLVIDVGEELGGTRDTERVNFMSAHVEAYPRLREDPPVLEEVRRTEERLSGLGRWFVPEDRLEQVENAIQDGDIIAATSTVAGLDVAHTGIAVRVDDGLRLLHAPLVGDSVEISEETLARRVRRIGEQDGVMVARPRAER